MWTGYRDVFEVDRRMVRDRSDRLQQLFLDGPKAREPQLQRIAEESARYNVGSVRRTVNLPTLPIFYLHPRNAARMKLTGKGNADVDGVVCRVFEFREQAWPTIVVTFSGDSIPAWGQVWIEPVTGAVHRAVLRFERGSSTRTSVDVRYRKADRLPVLVPSSLWEWYQGAGGAGSPDFHEQVIEGLATYSNLRRFTVETSEAVR